MAAKADIYGIPPPVTTRPPPRRPPNPRQSKSFLPLFFNKDVLAFVFLKLAYPSEE
jgi:hypothetical protein